MASYSGQHSLYRLLLPATASASFGLHFLTAAAAAATVRGRGCAQLSPSGGAQFGCCVCKLQPTDLQTLPLKICFNFNVCLTFRWMRVLLANNSNLISDNRIYLVQTLQSKAPTVYSLLHVVSLLPYGRIPAALIIPPFKDHYLLLSSSLIGLYEKIKLCTWGLWPYVKQTTNAPSTKI